MNLQATCPWRDKADPCRRTSAVRHPPGCVSAPKPLGACYPVCTCTGAPLKEHTVHYMRSCDHLHPPEACSVPLQMQDFPQLHFKGAYLAALYIPLGGVLAALLFTPCTRMMRGFVLIAEPPKVLQELKGSTALGSEVTRMYASMALPAVLGLIWVRCAAVPMFQVLRLAARVADQWHEPQRAWQPQAAGHRSLWSMTEHDRGCKSAASLGPGQQSEQMSQLLLRS